MTTKFYEEQEKRQSNDDLIQIYDDNQFADFIVNYVKNMEEVYNGDTMAVYMDLHLMSAFDTFENYPYYAVQTESMAYPICKGFNTEEELLEFLDRYESLYDYTAKRFGLDEDIQEV